MSHSFRKAFAYDFACPSCAATNTWYVSTRWPAIVEGELVEASAFDGKRTVSFRHPSTLTSDRKSICMLCSVTIVIKDGAFAVA